MYDRDGVVAGYELLFRAGADSTGASQSDSAATTQVIVNAFSEFGLEQLVGLRPGFVNLTRDFLVGDLAVPFDNHQAVLEVLETVEVDAEVVAGVERLVGQGYAIALDDFVWGSGHEKLLPLAQYVKLEIADIEQAKVVAAVQACREYPGLGLVAERLETNEDLRFARDQGFDLFQGYLLGRPQVMSAAALSPSQIRRVELIGYLSSPDANLKKITSIITLDPALSYRMLRVASSAASGRRGGVSSVEEATVLLGTTRLLQWLSLMAISDLVSLGEDQVVSTMARARLCQLLAKDVGANLASAYTAGMLAGVCKLLATSMDDLTSQLSLSEELVAALVDGTGPLGAVLEMVRAYEERDLPALARAGVSTLSLSRSYLAAIEWALRTYQYVQS